MGYRVGSGKRQVLNAELELSVEFLRGDGRERACLMAVERDLDIKGKTGKCS